MTTIDELKRIVVQNLESHGIISELRAKLRTNVFKVYKHTR